MPGSTRRVSSVSATMLTWSMSPSRPGSICAKRPAAPNPALLTSTSIVRPRPAISSARASAASGRDRSAAMTVVSAPPRRNSSARACIGSIPRAVENEIVAMPRQFACQSDTDAARCAGHQREWARAGRFMDCHPCHCEACPRIAERVRSGRTEGKADWVHNPVIWVGLPVTNTRRPAFNSCDTCTSRIGR